ncbi:MAG: DUF523 and DUF1722 domain-containing protein [Thermoproteota archaeon]
MKHPRPRVVVSECLGFRPTRYDGNMFHDKTVEALRRFADLLPVRPEIGIGLGVPRNPLVITRNGDSILLVDTKTGEDFSDSMEKFAKSFISSLADVDGFLMKSKSPSCGVGDAKVYGKGWAAVGRSDGTFTMLMRNAFPLLPVESEKRLLKYEVRRNFFTKIFSIADLRETLSKAETDNLVELHRRNKYILMLYNPSLLKRLGRLIAERAFREPRELKENYRRLFQKALSRNPGRGSYTNVFTHIYSHIKENLTAKEMGYILTLIDDYRMGRNHLKTLTVYFKGFIYRLGNEYLAEQRFIEPYPEELEHIEEE